ncbi:hypothetical protein [Neobacillus fumarioli]|nr:hypothetical protein [Neobacillus fumarioli]
MVYGISREKSFTVAGWGSFYSNVCLEGIFVEMPINREKLLNFIRNPN